MNFRGVGVSDLGRSVDFAIRTHHGTDLSFHRSSGPDPMAAPELDEKNVDRLARLYVEIVRSTLVRSDAQGEPRQESSRADADQRANMAVLAKLSSIFATDDLASRAIVDGLLRVKRRANEIEAQDLLLSHMRPAGHG